MEALISHKEFCTLTGLSPRKVIYYCELGLVKTARGTTGRGCPRKFDAQNVKEALIAKTLLQHGFTKACVLRTMHTLRDSWKDEKPSA